VGHLCSFYHLLKGVFRWIEIKDAPVWAVFVLHPATPGVHFNATQGSHVQQTGFVFCHQVLAVAPIGFTPLALIVHASHPAKTFAEFDRTKRGNSK
jgi:hypothetical protein